jgi:RimJ/RimL family protein N-acetyltransferase
MNKKLPKLNILKSNYGPKSFGLYSQEDNAKRKESRTGESVDAAGPNLEVRYAGPTRSQQAENQARADKLKSKKNPVKIFTAKERKQLARKRGLLAASEDMKKAPQLANQDDDFAFKQLDEGSFDDRFHTNLVTRKLKNGLFHHVFSMKNSPDNVIHSISSGNPEYPHSVIVGVKANPEKDGTDANFVARYTATHPDHQGKGMATGLKKLALKHHGSIQSDGIVSDGEHASWQKLGRVSGIDLKPGKTQYDLADEDGDPDEEVQEHHEHDAVYFPHVATYKKPKKLAASKLAKGARGDWKKEGYRLSHKLADDSSKMPSHGDQFGIFAHDKNGKFVGSAYFTHHGSYIQAADDDGNSSVIVHPEHQRKGLATAMYQHAEKISQASSVPSEGRFEPGKKFWSQPNRPFGKSLEKSSTPQAPKVNLNPEHGKIIADAYHNMKHDPNHPEVKAAYGALIDETKKQYQDLLNSGLKVSKIKDPKHNPYPTSKHLHADVDAGRIQYFPTEHGFGSEDSVPQDHPMLQPTEFKDDEGKPMLANDIFRVVHDKVHHTLRNGFGPKGEHESFLEHKKSYSPLAQKALMTETAGQNSYVNFSSQIGHLNQQKPGSAYAPQKAGLLPDHVIKGKWHE